MKAILTAIVFAAGFATVATTTAQASSGYGRSYAYDYCFFYKSRALGARSQERKQLMWARYRACLREYGG